MDEVYSVTGADAEELTASTGVGVDGAGGDGIETGVVDAKRIPAPARNIRIDCDGTCVLSRDVGMLERRELPRMGPWCTEEENYPSQYILLCNTLGMHTCRAEKVSRRRRPMPMAWPDQRRPLLGIMLCC